MNDRLLDTQAASDLLGVEPRTLEGWRLRGGGPPYVKVGRLVRYRRADLDRWVAERTRASTSDAPPTGRAA
jgi:excisionase family DNA binding protein